MKMKAPMRARRASVAAMRAVAPSRWRESLVVVLIGCAVLWLSALPAFRAFFIGEAFLYLGQYQAQGSDLWRALRSPSDGIFFKPVLFAASLPWYFVLPPDPVIYHLRNALVASVNLLLLHRILVRLVANPTARASPCSCSLPPRFI